MSKFHKMLVLSSILIGGTVGASTDDFFSAYQDFTNSIFAEDLYFNCYYGNSSSYSASYKLEKSIFGKKTLSKLQNNGDWIVRDSMFDDTSVSFKIT